jgi:hypothetical protein
MLVFLLQKSKRDDMLAAGYDCYDDVVWMMITKRWFYST